ncbi:oligosaccharide repeat unit polymerase [Anthocerotibacter panamensis]|uniref:oligosaccharide repeat unit polymerase n=1 Tax=Anthocerotibacter panamensis TaxID=2857077 RepID=UPI001C40354B|nr:oligosaccharide repeat unit polymerase [Anthocerotibacter panamensis]
MRKSNFLLPHSIFFILYNMIYIIPLVSFQLIGYSEGGLHTLDLPQNILYQAALVYFVGILSFIAGSELTYFGFQVTSSKSLLTPQPRKSLSLQFKILFFLVVLLYAISKIGLRSLGVYENYSFDAGTQVGGLWTISTVLSEILVLLTTIILASNDKQKKSLFIFSALTISVNLLHGTRIFTIIAVLSLFVYLYIVKNLSFLKLIFYLPISGVVLVAAYLTFLFRSKVEVSDLASGVFTIEKLVSPIFYESVFTQLSLVSVLSKKSWSLEGAPLSFLSDLVFFTLPRFLSPNKEATLFSKGVYAGISPLGGFSGYAQGLIYFGVFFFLFYFVLGVTTTLLYEGAKKNEIFFAFYLYIVGDIIYRIARDGYLIPLKALITAPFIILVFLFVYNLTYIAVGKSHRGEHML